MFQNDHNHEYSDTSRDPWDQGTYQTGHTKPPKNYGGAMAVLLMVVILLCGIVSIATMINLSRVQSQTLQANNPQDPQSPVPIQSNPVPESTASPEATESSVMPQDSQGKTSLDPASISLNTSPTAVENIPQEGGLSLQEIYAKGVVSTVSVLCRTDSGTSSGTGVILSANGYVVTNCHVVEDAQAISVVLYDDTELEAQLVGKDAVSDLAVLYVNGKNLTPAEFGDSGSLRVGDLAVAIGDPLGQQLSGTMTDGIISGINRDITTGGRTMTLIQTNAALNEGNSGGPLLNCYGQVIGINTLKIGDYISSAGVEGLGFAIPSVTVLDIVNQIITQGYVSGRPSLGFTCEALSRFDQIYWRYPSGMLITDVAENSNAQTLGLRAGDILLSLDGVSVTTQDQLQSLINGCQVGDEVEMVIYRSGKRYTATLTVQEDGH